MRSNIGVRKVFPNRYEPQLNKPGSSGSSRFKHCLFSFYGVLACFTGFIGTIANDGVEEAKNYRQSFPKEISHQFKYLESGMNISNQIILLPLNI
jgi:hypothetical protein